MLGKNSLRKFTTLATLAAFWCVTSMVALAMPTDLTAQITVSGQVTVNGQPAVTNSTVVSGSTIVTGAGSSATVSLGKAGRIEVQENSNIKLDFSENSIIGSLAEGKYRISNAAGVATTMTTKNATVMGDAGQANSFAIEVECSHIHVDTTSGLVTMREGSTDKQVVAGTTATAGSLTQTGCKPCLRPGSAPAVAIAGWPWLIAVAGGIAAAGIFFGTRKGNTNVGDQVVVISPTR